MTPIDGKIQSVRLYTRDAAGQSQVLGQTTVASDGSFYVEVPADRPIRMELLDAAGTRLRAEEHWFWMRPSEQRICVGCHAGPERAPENQVPAILNQTLKPVKMLADHGRTSMTLRPGLYFLPLLAAITLTAQNSGPISFEDVTAQSGITFTHSFGAEKLGSLLESTGAGCVWFDYNNDGKPDLFVASGRPMGKDMHPYPLRSVPAVMPHNHLYRNDGNGKFTDVTEQAGVGGDGFSFAAIAADFDNDGLTDLLVTSYGNVTLYRNKGDGTFEDVTAKAGLNVKGWAIGATWLDYDRDGCIDLFVGRYVKFDPAYRSYYAADNYPGPLDYAAETNLLFHNNCHGGFVDVSEKSGIAKFKGRAMGVTAADFDGDGYPDVYVANDRTESFLFHNKHDGTFEEIALEAGAAFGQNGESSAAMGPVFFDMNNSGHADLWVSDSKYNRLLQNSGKLPFTDVTQQAGISQLAAQYISWGAGAFDFDNDGRTDLLVFHGGLIHMVPQEHSIFWNLGGTKFEDVSTEAGPFFATKSVGRGALLR